MNQRTSLSDITTWIGWGRRGQPTSGNLADSCMMPAFFRGEAQLGAGNTRQALAEFRKFSTDAGIVGSCWSAPLAKLGVARAEGLSCSTRNAKKVYANFLDLWKGADTDLPLLKQAQAEAAKFH